MKTTIAVLTLLASINAFAAVANLVPGKKIYVDSGFFIEGKSATASLLLTTKSTNADAEPKYTLLSQYSGFECTYKQTLLVDSSFDNATGVYTNKWDIQVDYTTGTDISACSVKVSFPGMKDSLADLYINY